MCYLQVLRMKNYWNSKLSECAFLFFVLTPFLAHSQFSKPEENLSSGVETYLYPVYPGQPGSLAGTMGELRTTHFHSGIDIRTNNMIGLPIRASKSGYISRITTSGTGYGNVIYITHPDGNTTLYAHLDKFKGAVADHILEEQYRLKSGEIDLYFKPDQFKVSRGDTIGLSGNSGSSGGPHLHFDIRDSLNHALDPIKVAGFTELADKYPPAAEKIALRTLDINSRINDRFGRFEFYAQRLGANKFVIASPIIAYGNIGVELIAKDKLAAQSQFYGGVNYIEMKVDSQLLFKQAIEKINIAETRGIYTLMDYRTMRMKGTRFYKLYIEDGNNLKFYGESPASGKIKVNPSKNSHVEIIMKDSDGNASVVYFDIKPDIQTKEVSSLETLNDEMTSDILENTMVVTTKPCNVVGNKARVYLNGVSTEIEPNYYNQNQSVYLLDLRKTIPDSITVCDTWLAPHIKAVVPAGSEYKYYSDLMDVTFPADALYDTVYLNTHYTTTTTGKELFTLGSRSIPLNKSILVTLKPKKIYPADSKYGVYRLAGRGYTYIGGEWINDKVSFNTREFGDFTILRDSIPPSVRQVFVNSSSARFKIKDALSGIAYYEANLNGEWILMHYDNKNGVIWSERKSKKIPMKGLFELTVTDNAGNKTTFKQKVF
jgi:murein DD-endopeptidase MepM/ murein hydrolase activator NlpD